MTSGRLVGPRIATWSPGWMPRACMPAPMTRASSCSCDHGTRTRSSFEMNVAPWPRSAARSIRSDQRSGRHGHKTCARQGRLRITPAESAPGQQGSASILDLHVRPSRRPCRCPCAQVRRPRSRTRSRPAGRPRGTPTARTTPRIRPAPWTTDSRRCGGKPKIFVLDMFPYPSGDGLHVGHPLGFIGTDVYARYLRMTGHNVLHTMGFDAFGLPAEQYAVQTGQHPRITTEANVANYRRQLHRLGLGHDPRRSISTTDVTFYRWTQWIFLQIFNSWYDAEAKKARPIDELVTSFESGDAGRSRWTRLGEARLRAATRGRRLLPSRLPRRSAGELVPRIGHGAGQRRGDVRRTQRSRQLPCLQATPEAVEDADHRVRRPFDRRPRRPRLARVDQADTAQLDRPQRRRADPLPRAVHRRADHRCSRRAQTPCSARPTWSLLPSTLSSTSSRRRHGPRARPRSGHAAPPHRSTQSRTTSAPRGR